MYEIEPTRRPVLADFGPCRLVSKIHSPVSRLFLGSSQYIYEEWDVNTAWTAFKEHTKLLIPQHVPTKITPTRYSPPWITSVVERTVQKTTPCIQVQEVRYSKGQRELQEHQDGMPDDHQTGTQ